MAIPPRRCVGYALLFGGLLLLFDTYTFLHTNWSPLHVPMFAPTELNLGCVLALCGVALILAPTFVRMVGSYASDASMKLGQNLAYESVEFRLRERLPLKKKLSVLPNRGLVGGTVVLLLLIPMFLLVDWPQPGKGIYVELGSRPGWGHDENCLAGPIVVTVKRQHESSQLHVNGTEVNREALSGVLRTSLSTRANWEVFVEGDDYVDLGDAMYVVDVVHALHAKAVILTPSLKREMAKDCLAR